MRKSIIYSAPIISFRYARHSLSFRASDLSWNTCFGRREGSTRYQSENRTAYMPQNVEDKLWICR